MEHATLYLQKLRFDKRLSDSFIAKYLGNPRFVFLVLISIISLGIFSYNSLPRRLNPEIEIPIVVVSTILPGANPEDVESLITEPLESEINSLTDISQITSTSQENVSLIQVEFNSGVDPEAARDDVQGAVDQVELPEDSQNPDVSKIDFENQPVWTFSVTGGDPASLSRFSTELSSRLEDEEAIRDVQVSGLEEQEVAVSFLPEALTAYSISPPQLSALIRSAVGSYPAGNVNTDTLTFPLSIDPTVTTVDDVRNLQLNVDGTSIPLSEIAIVTERAKPGQLQSFFADRNTQPAQSVTFDVYKTSAANINDAVVDSERVVEEVEGDYEDVFRIQTVINTGELIDEQFRELLRDFSIIVFLVFVVLFIFLGLRQAFVSFFAVPLTFLISFIVMMQTGISLNFLSMFSLLLSLGLLVDDTIVVISAMTSYYRTGKFTPLETGLLVWRDFGVPILTTTLTTVWAFLPLLLATGIIGEFIKAIPIVVSSTLIASLFVAMLVILPMMILLLSPSVPRRVKIFLQILFVASVVAVYFVITPKGTFFIPALVAFCIFVFVVLVSRREFFGKISGEYRRRSARSGSFLARALFYSQNGVIHFGRIESVYRRLLSRILVSRINRRNTLIIVAIFSIFSYLLLPLGFVKNEFFPASDQEYLYVTLEMPAGTNLETTTSEARKFLNDLRRTNDVSYVTADLGRSFSETGGYMPTGENIVLFSLVLPERSARAQSSVEIADDLRRIFSGYTRGELTVSEVSGGPPAGADVVIQLFGDDLSQLDLYAEEIATHLEGQDGVVDVQKSVRPGASKLVFEPELQKLAENNLSEEQLGLWLRTFASGFPLETLQLEDNGEDDTDITLRIGDGVQRVEDIYLMSVVTQTGSVPLAELGELRIGENPTQISRKDGKRSISVNASVRPGFSITDVNADLEQYVDSQLDFETGYTWSTGGVNEENQESVNSILQAMLLSFLLIILTMVIQFGSFRKAIIVMLVIPLSISGVFILFALTQTPLSFPALIGMLALFGIVVKNSILIVDKINANERVGMKFEDSIIDASVSRLEAIALTSITAIIGLIPITLSDPLWQGLGGAIIAGLTFSGTIMLFFIPVVYYYLFAPRIAKKKG